MSSISQSECLLASSRTGDASFLKLLRRPETNWQSLVELLPELAIVSPEVARQIEFDAKYEGYIVRQEQEVERHRRLGERRIPHSFDYGRLTQLRIEAREKLDRVRPLNIAQASRISGITPADVALLMIHLDAR